MLVKLIIALDIDHNPFVDASIEVDRILNAGVMESITAVLATKLHPIPVVAAYWDFP